MAETTQRKLHCPNCKSTNIAISTESSVTGAVTTGHGRFASTTVSNDHKNFWFCSDCGTKFRNIQNLEEEIVKTKKSVTVGIVFTIIVVILAVVNLLGNPFGRIIAGPAFFAAIIFALVTLSFKSKVKKLTKELEDLKVNCFD